MDPLTQIVLWSILILTTINLFKRPMSVQALPSPSTPSKEIGSSGSGHTLVKTWIEKGGDGVIRGWRAKCSCGAVSYATDATHAKPNKVATFGTEDNAIAHFESHAKNFNRVNGNVWKDKHDALLRELEDQKASCFCKDVSSVQLLPMKD